MNTPISIHDTKKTQIPQTPIETSTERSQIDLKVNTEPETNTDLYSAGWFDGLMGYSPEFPHFQDYWLGYQIGYREYCCGLLGIEISTSEISTKDLLATRC